MCIFFLSYDSKATGIFVILQNRDGFKGDPETSSKQSLCKVSSEAAVCVYIYSSTVKVSSIVTMTETYLRGTDQRSCVLNINLDPSAKFLHLGI